MDSSDSIGRNDYDPGEVSLLLERILGGDRSAEGRLFDLLYTDLRRMAAYQLRKERSDHTLQPTALVNEVYVKIFRQTPPRLAVGLISLLLPPK